MNNYYIHYLAGLSDNVSKAKPDPENKTKGYLDGYAGVLPRIKHEGDPIVTFNADAKQTTTTIENYVLLRTALLVGVQALNQNGKIIDYRCEDQKFNKYVHDLMIKKETDG